MPLYEVVLEQRYFNQQTINRWNYMLTGTPAAVTGSFGLLSIMGFLAASTTLLEGTIAGELQQLQNQAVVFVQATARAVFIDDDFYGNAFLANTIGGGEASASALSPTVAFGFRSSRVKQSIRRGYKRFVGVGEQQVANGGSFIGGGAAQMEEVAEAMSETLVYDDEGTSLTYTPCIVQKEKYTTPSGKDAYRYYATEVAQSAHLAQGIDWEIYDFSRTQGTRQYGRGS